MPRGGAEIDIAVLFADVRGSTALGESMSASAFASLRGKDETVTVRVIQPSMLGRA
ncbi:MAG: hypothetical protein O7F09_06610 [Chloroflexi bacterium]|nr:hypothetical protein [Chloroflexota bacterium]MCZ6892170.1 hypothetical protein [Chloroflexota bacterium]